MQAYVGGLAPRSESYMRTHWDHAKAFIDDDALAAAATEEEATWVAAQKAAGLSPLSPAYTRWEDLLRPLATFARGVQPGQLTRFFETNTFYRTPHVTGPLEAGSDADVAAATPLVAAGSPWVLTLPSPWDFAVRAQDDHYGDLAALAEAAGHTLTPVIDLAVENGAVAVRFQDPSILYERTPHRDIDALREALRTAAGHHAPICTLHAYQGDITEHPDVADANPLAGLSIEDPGIDPGAIDLPGGTKITLALTAGNESLVEEPERLATRATQWMDAGHDVIAVTNGWDLDHVPHEIGLAKLKALGQVASHLTKEVLA